MKKTKISLLVLFVVVLALTITFTNGDVAVNNQDVPSAVTCAIDFGEGSLYEDVSPMPAEFKETCTKLAGA